jgi:soluble lytic murein transglycosylase-like protein/TolA-binding protein
MKNILRNIILLLSIQMFLHTPSAFGGEAADIPGGAQFLEGRRLQSTGEWAASIERFKAASDVYSYLGDYALYQTSQSALQVGDIDLMASALTDLLSLHPKTPVASKARMDLVNLYVNTGDEAKAIPYIEAALRGAGSDSESAALTLMLAGAYAASGDASKAESVYWRVVYGWPSSAEALKATGGVGETKTPEKLLAVAKVYSLNKKSRKALDILQELMIDPRVAPMMPEILFHMAKSFAREPGRKPAAADLYAEIVAEYSESSMAAPALFELAEYHRSSGNTTEALSEYALIVERFPAKGLAAVSVRERAKIFEKLGNPAEYDEYLKLLENYPKYKLTHVAVMHWGVKLYRDGDYAGARAVFEKLGKADLNYDANADAAFWIAKCNIAGGNINLAKIQLAGVIKRFRESHQGFRARSILKTLAGAQALYSNGATGKWEKFFAFEKEPFVSLENYSTGEAYPALEKEMPHLAGQELDRLRFLMLNELPEAKWELAEISKNMSGPNARYALAWALFQTGSYNEAIKAASSLRGSIADEPRETRLRYLLYPAAYPDEVSSAAARHNVDPMLSLAVMREESHFREGTISSADARGLMQIIPSTGEWLAGKIYGPAGFDRTMLLKPGVNIEIGSYYLRYLLDRFDDDELFALAAYNWGEGNLKRWLAGSPPGDLDVFIERIPADETRRYVKKVLRSYAVYHSLYPDDYLTMPGK